MQCRKRFWTKNGPKKQKSKNPSNILLRDFLAIFAAIQAQKNTPKTRKKAQSKQGQKTRENRPNLASSARIRTQATRARQKQRSKS
jgi:hypothetical protein